MDVAARRAAPDDADVIACLRAAAADEVSGARPGRLLVREGRFLSPSAADVLVGVVEIDAAVVGFVEAALVELGDGAALCRVTSLYVEPAAREVGAGEALMELTSSWASGRGAEGIDVAVLPGSREAKNFLESEGFAARLLVMHRRLAPGP